MLNKEIASKMPHSVSEEEQRSCFGSPDQIDFYIDRLRVTVPYKGCESVRSLKLFVQHVLVGSA